MNPVQNEHIAHEAKQVLHDCITAAGFVASPRQHDNYRRIWSRDAVIAGVTSVIINDAEGKNALKNSVLALGQHQNKFGQIPSNIPIDSAIGASFGSLVGRIDSTSWWIIGACITLELDSSYRSILEQRIVHALTYLEVMELNGRGLLFTPLGGNWADEYVSQGYVLYDQLLRIWALKAADQVLDNSLFVRQADQLTQLVTYNYSFTASPDANHYHASAYARVYGMKKWWACSFGPAGYDQRWDMAAHALLMVLGILPHTTPLSQVLFDDLAHPTTGLIPAFSPVILPTDSDWNLLKDNYRYTFKNHPYQFHNGGCWPVMMGLLGLGFALQNNQEATKKIMNTLQNHMEGVTVEMRFAEYWDPTNGKPNGVFPLCFSACGFLLLSHNYSETNNLKSKILC